MRRTPASGSLYSACSDVTSSKSVGGSSTSAAGSVWSGAGCAPAYGVEAASPTTSGKAETASTGGVSESAGRVGLGSGHASGSGRVRRSRALRAARWRPCPERRRIAPSEAPESKSVPTSMRRTPSSSEPVAPIAIPTAPPSSWPRYPPWSLPSVIIRPQPSTASPVRNGRTSTSALRVTTSAPSATSSTGRTYFASPMSLSSPSSSQPPT